MFEFKSNIKVILLILRVIIFYYVTPAEAEEEIDDDNGKLIIRGELDPKTSEFITKKLDELKETDEKLRADIYTLQDKLISRNKDKISLNIYVSVENNDNSPNYGIIQLTGTMNNISLIRYDHPLIFEKNEKFPLFEGDVPLGVYEFKINAIVGQQLEKWPFILPEGKWSVEKVVKIDAHIAGNKRDLQIALKADKVTGIPQLVLESEDEKK